METPSQVHARLQGAVRCHVPPEQQAHRWAMLAKESIFRAQDALWEVPEHMLDEVEASLREIRRALEAFDRQWRANG